MVATIEDDEPTIVEEKEANKVYIRDKDRHQVPWMQETTFPPLLSTSSPNECPESPPSPKSPSNSDSSAPIPEFSDLDVPIANRKGVRSCT